MSRTIKHAWKPVACSGIINRSERREVVDGLNAVSDLLGK